MQVLLVEIDVELDPEVGKRTPDLLNIRSRPSLRKMANASASSRLSTSGRRSTTAAAMSLM